MTSGRFAFVVLLGLAFVVIGLSAFTVNERERAIKLQLGQVVEADYQPGLHFKWPVVQNIRKFPKRILTISDRPERVFTAENEALQVDFFVKWRIVDPVRFYTSTGGAQVVANDRLSEIIKNAVVTEFGKRTVVEAISVGRAELMRDIYDAKFRRSNVPLPKIVEVAANDFYGEGYEDSDRRIPDIDKARQLLGWEPRYELRELLELTIAHYAHPASKH